MIILRSYVTYKPLRTFFYFSLLPALLGLGIGIRFLIYFFSGDGGHIQSLILAAILLIVAFHLLSLGILADLMSANRKLIQEILFHTRSHNYENRKRSEGHDKKI